jgi:predicted anti-sigma-YlaC factor YlaD
MMFDPCRDMRAALGAAALGGIDAADDVALRAHLDGCAQCRAELAELSSVARALPLADPAALARPNVEPPRELGERVLGRLAGRRAERRRRRIVTSLAAAVVAVLVVASVAVLATRSGSPARRITLAGAHGVVATATLRDRPAGTQVAFHVSGLHDGDYYWLWLTGVDGERVGAGTFRGTPASVDLTSTAAIRLEDTRRIWVTDARDAVVLDTAVAPR